MIDNYIFPNWSIIVGWLMTLSSMCCIPLYAIYHYSTTKGTPIERLVKSFRPINDNDINYGRDELKPIKNELTQITHV